MKRSMIVPAAMAMMLALGAQAQEAPVADDTVTEATEAAAADAMDTSDMAKDAASEKASEMVDAAEDQVAAKADEVKDDMVAEAKDKADEMMADTKDAATDTATEMVADTEDAATMDAPEVETATAETEIEAEVTEVADETVMKTTTVTTAAAPTTTTTVSATETTGSLDGLTVEELNARQLASMKAGSNIAPGTVFVASTTPTVTTTTQPTTTSSTTYTTVSTPASTEMTEAKPMVMADTTTSLETGEIERTVLPSGVTRTVTRVVVAEGQSGADSYTGSTTTYAAADTTAVTTETADTATVYAGTETTPETYEDASETSAAGSMEPVEANTLVDIAAGDATFTTLVSLVQQAELAEALSSEGPFTVFAPTNAAFEGLDADLVSRLTSGTANDELATVLKGHVVSGTILAADIAEGETTLTTLAGTDLVINRTADGVMAGNAAISSTDIEGSNGVIHVLDAVILPVAAEATMMEKIVAPAMDKTGMMEEADISDDPDMKSMIEDKVEAEVEDKVEEMATPE